MAMTRNVHATLFQSELRRAASRPEQSITQSFAPQNAHTALLQAHTALAAFHKRERNKKNAEYLSTVMQTVTLAMLDLEEEESVWSRHLDGASR